MKSAAIVPVLIGIVLIAAAAGILMFQDDTPTDDGGKPSPTRPDPSPTPPDDVQPLPRPGPAPVDRPPPSSDPTTGPTATTSSRSPEYRAFEAEITQAAGAQLRVGVIERIGKTKDPAYFPLLADVVRRYQGTEPESAQGAALTLLGQEHPEADRVLRELMQENPQAGWVMPIMMLMSARDNEPGR